MNPAYLNFDLTIEQTEDGDFVRILDSPAGPASAPFVVPFTRKDLEHFIQVMTTGEQDHLERTQAQLELARQFGERLFQSLLHTETRRAFHNSFYMAYHQRVGLRLRLHAAHQPQWAQLPWEYLYDSARQEFMALSLHSPLVRYLEFMHRIVPLKAKPPLRMLVVIASPLGYPAAHAERTWLSLLDTLDYLALEGKLLLERLAKPTLFDLQRQLRQKEYHLLHLIGHATTDVYTQDGYWVFEDEMGRGRLVSGQHLGAMVRDHFSLRFVLLQANARAGVGQNPYTNIAQSLVQRGLPAAVALPSVLAEPLALTFANGLYAALCAQQPVDLAVTAARQALHDVDQSVSWGAPQLLTRAPDGRLFEEAPAEQEKQPNRGRKLS